MINRALIRLKVVQIVYAYYQNGGKNLDTAVGAYNSFVGSMESQVLTQARRFEALDIDTAGKSIDALPVVETATRPQTKLVTTAEECD